MNVFQLKKLREFESAMKKQIINDYNNFLTSSKKEELLNDTLIKNDYNNHFTSTENIQGEIIRLIFDKVFDKISCNKNIKFNDGNRIIPYASNIKFGLIIYYSNEFANKNKIRIDSPLVNTEVDFIKQLKDKLGTTFETIAFNCDGLTLLNAANIPEIIKQCDSHAVKKYVQSRKTKEKEGLTLTSRIKLLIPLIYINGEQYLLYIIDDKETIIKINNPTIVSKTYRQMLKNGKNGVDINEFFNTITKAGEIIPAYNNTLNNSSKLTNEEKKLLDTLYTKKDNLFKNKNIDIDDCPTTKISIRLITEDEYEKLCMKTINNISLTDEEIQLMTFFDNYHYGDKNNQISNIPNTLKQDNKKNIIPIIIILTIFIGIIFGTLLFKILN